jgi:HSP20 family protein
MTIVRRPSPFGELMSLRSAMDRLFEDSFVRRPFGDFDQLGALPLDVTSTADALIVEAALPGFKPEDVEITVENNTLTIRGDLRQERNEGEGENLVQEIRRTSVSRTVALPAGLEADKATASFENGMLKLSFPKAEAIKPRQIRISATGGQPAKTIEGTSTPVDTSANGMPGADQASGQPIGAGTGQTGS